MNYLNWLSLVLVVLLCGTGCGRSTDNSKSQTITHVSLIKLTQDSNAYIRNNARRADTCWKARDYDNTVTAMRVIMKETLDCLQSAGGRSHPSRGWIPVRSGKWRRLSMCRQVRFPGRAEGQIGARSFAGLQKSPTRLNGLKAWLNH